MLMRPLRDLVGVLIARGLEGDVSLDSLGEGELEHTRYQIGFDDPATNTLTLIRLTPLIAVRTAADPGAIDGLLTELGALWARREAPESGRIRIELDWVWPKPRPIDRRPV